MKHSFHADATMAGALTVLGALLRVPYLALVPFFVLFPLLLEKKEPLFGLLLLFALRQVCQALCALPDLDVIDICTPSFLHYEQTLQALEAGKHVILEKPMATRLDDARRLVDRAAALGLAHVEFVAGDVATMTLPGPFDVVLGRWSVNYLHDVVGALARAPARGRRSRCRPSRRSVGRRARSSRRGARRNPTGRRVVRSTR